MAASASLRVVMASTRLPPPGTTATGTPAHVRKTASAVRLARSLKSPVYNNVD